MFIEFRSYLIPPFSICQLLGIGLIVIEQGIVPDRVPDPGPTCLPELLKIESRFSENNNVMSTIQICPWKEDNKHDRRRFDKNASFHFYQIISRF